MTDFYSVLKTSIVRRDLRSPADRQEVYGQARNAMIRKLWSFDPPLAEDEIDTRIGLFDAAVERIEGDLELAFAEADAVEARPRPRREPPRRAPAPTRAEPMVYEGYDEEADYTPAYSPVQSRSADYGTTALERTRDRQPLPPRYEDPYADDAEDEPPPRYASSSPPQRVMRQPQQWEEPEDDRRPARRAESYRAPLYEDAVYDEREPVSYTQRGADYDAPDPYDDIETHEPDDRRGGRFDRRDAGRSRGRDWERETAGYAAETDYDDADDYRAPAKPKRKGRAAIAREVKRNPVRSLTIAIAALAVLLIGFNAYVFLPLIFGPERPTASSPAVPAKIDDRLPSAESGAAAATRIVSDAATASEIPERSLDVTESLVIFDGRDPTVFEGSSDNPIQFESDAEGGFARISSSASAAGARAVIGPGLAERLAGRTVRITLLARTSDYNGAVNMRFAYQSGVAISHWQSANLATSYGSYGMIWRVPAAHTSGVGDYLLIEPGVPGDGTSTDIRSIKIDILAS